MKEIFFGNVDHVKDALNTLETSGEDGALKEGDVVVVGSDLVYWESLQVFSSFFTRFERIKFY